MHFIINTITHWDEPPRARHQLSAALSKKYPVTFVSANKTGFPAIKKNTVNENMDVILPYFPVEVRVRTKIPFINKIYQRWLYKWLKKKYPDSVIINFDFTASLIFNYFKNVIYYCNDDFTALSRNHVSFIKNYHNRTEQIAASRSVFCVSTSSFLKEKLSKHNKSVHEIRLGGPDIRDYNVKPAYIPVEKNKNLKVAFLGFISTAYPEILNSIIERPELDLTIIGPHENTKKIIINSKVRLTGILTGNELYEEINKAHVAIIPYRFNSVVDRTPNKLWQYFAVGKPVVISDINGIKNWNFPDKFLYKAKNTKDFIDKIFAAVNDNSPELVEARVKESFKNTWEERANDFIKILKNHLTT